MAPLRNALPTLGMDPLTILLPIPPSRFEILAKISNTDGLALLLQLLSFIVVAAVATTKECGIGHDLIPYLYHIERSGDGLRHGGSNCAGEECGILQ